jgi:hypothetical protein
MKKEVLLLFFLLIPIVQGVTVDFTATITAKDIYNSYNLLFYVEDNEYQSISNIQTKRSVFQNGSITIKQIYPPLNDTLNMSFSVDLDAYPITQEQHLISSIKADKKSEYYNLIKESQNLWDMIYPAVQYLNDRKMDEKNKYFKRILDDLKIPARFCNGYVSDGNGWYFSTWVEVPVSTHTVFYDFDLKEYGLFTTPHIAFYCGENVSYDFLSLSYSAKSDVDIQISQFDIDINDVLPNNTMNPEIDIFPLHKKIRVGSANAVSLIIYNHRNQYIPVKLIQPARESLKIEYKELFYFIPPRSKEYYDIILTDVQALRHSNEHRIKFIINGFESQVLFTLDPNGVYVSEESVRSMIDKGVRVNNYPTFDDFSKIIKDIPVEYQQEAYDNHKKAMEKLGITKEIIQEDGKNIVKIIIDPRISMYNVSLYENIPKCLAQQVNEISSERVFEIIDEDPIVAWHIDELSQPIEIKYDLSAKNISDCSDEAMTLAIAEMISEDMGGNNAFNIIIPFFIAFITSITIIFFAKFSGEVT